MRGCDLCRSAAAMHCESDQASLCWECDGKVHGANFLVARHVRNLLCNACQSLTPWKASGAKLSPTMSFCDACAVEGRENRDPNIGEEGERSASSDGSNEYYSEDGHESEEDEADNQVVPLSPPLPSSSSSSSSNHDFYSHGDDPAERKILSLEATQSYISGKSRCPVRRSSDFLSGLVKIAAVEKTSKS